jgi:hypothetical protein
MSLFESFINGLNKSKLEKLLSKNDVKIIMKMTVPLMIERTATAGY